MSKIKIPFEKRDLLYGAWITIIVAALAGIIGLVGISTKFYDPIKQIFDPVRLSDSFFYIHHQKIDNSTDSDVVIVDLAGYSSRMEIAQVVNSINKCSPKAVAVDIIFPQIVSSASSEDSLLVDTFRSCPNLVLAQRLIKGKDTYSYMERSFFADKVECIEAEVSFENGIVRSIPAANNGYPSIVSVIADILGRRKVRNGELINYSYLNVPKFDIKKISSSKDFLTGKVIILGDGSDLRDYHDTPVLFDGVTRTSGLNIIAYSLNTLNPKMGFTTASNWVEMLIGIILTYLFCAFLASPIHRMGEYKDFYMDGARIVTLVMLLIVSYVLFWVFHIYVYLGYWLVGWGLSGLATGVFYKLYSKR